MISDLLTVVKNRQQREPQRLEWTAELVARFWDGVWTTRLKELSFARQAGRALIVAIDHLLPPGASVLDFGAGVGDLTDLLLQRDVLVAAHETSPAGRAALVQRFANRQGFLGTPAPGEGNQFDLVLLAEVIEHILDDELDNTLESVSRWTRPGGTVVVTTPNNEDLELGMCVDPLSNVLFHRWQHVRSFTSKTLAASMAEYEFDEIVSHEVELSERLFVPFDDRWGDRSDSPSHLVEIRNDRPTLVGGRQNLLYIGRRRA